MSKKCWLFFKHNYAFEKQTDDHHVGVKCKRCNQVDKLTWREACESGIVHHEWNNGSCMHCDAIISRKCSHKGGWKIAFNQNLLKVYNNSLVVYPGTCSTCGKESYVGFRYKVGIDGRNTDELDTSNLTLIVLDHGIISQIGE